MRAARTRKTLQETARERRDLAADAGFGGFSVTSVLAGVLVAYGAFAILAGLAAAALDALGDDTDLTTSWEALGTMGGLVVAGLVLLSYLFGGYVAGRMARRNGLAHGAGVLLLGIVVVAAVATLARSSADPDTIASNLRSLGIPTTGDEWGHAGTVAGIASLLAVVAGSLLGGALGERWHARLVARAADPTVGAQAQSARQAEAARTQASRALARSEGRARAQEIERDRDRDRIAAGDATPGGDRAAEPAPARAGRGWTDRDGRGGGGAGDVALTRRRGAEDREAAPAETRVSRFRSPFGRTG